MEKIINEMIKNANENQDYELAETCYKLMRELAITCNAPSDWRDVGENMKNKFCDSEWITENCKLYEF